MVTFRRAALLLLLLPLLLFAGCAGVPVRQSESFLGCFDTAAQVMGYGEGFPSDAGRVRARVEELHQLFDIYHAYDGLVNAKTVNDNAGIVPVEVPRELYNVIRLGVEWHAKTDGKLNIALGPVVKLWKACAERGGGRPSAEELAAALSLCDIRDVILDDAAQTVYLAKPGMSLDLGSIAKGYASRLAVEEAKGAVLLNLGGNVAVNGPPSDGRAAWSVGIQNPNDPGSSIRTVSVASGAVVTSGDYERYYMDAGERLGHIIDPITAYPASLYRSVTLIGEDAGICDILSTALFLLPLEDGKRIALDADCRAIWVLPDLSVRTTED